MSKQHTPQEAEIEIIDDPSMYSAIEARHATADAIRQLRKEIEDLKVAKYFHHESYCRNCGTTNE
jgi:translation initiation factor RLI1